MELICLGSINKKTGEYVYPNIANKEDSYICPDCNKDLVFCKGPVRCPYFRHKVENNSCSRYNNPTESQIHLDAKMLMKYILEKKIPVSFTRICSSFRCQNEEIFEIPEMLPTSSIQLEHRFNYNGGLRIADIAYIDSFGEVGGGDIICIFEIYNTHKTLNEDRPNPWYEIDANKLIKTVNMMSHQALLIKIPCIRKVQCDECVKKIASRSEGDIDNIKQAIHFTKALNSKTSSRKQKDIKCQFCDQKNKTKCCMWNSYYKQHKRTDWESESFKNFKENMFQSGL